MTADHVSTDPAFTAYCPECESVQILENIAHVVRCYECSNIVLGTEVL